MPDKCDDDDDGNERRPGIFSILCMTITQRFNAFCLNHVFIKTIQDIRLKHSLHHNVAICWGIQRRISFVASYEIHFFHSFLFSFMLRPKHVSLDCHRPRYPLQPFANENANTFKMLTRSDKACTVLFYFCHVYAIVWAYSLPLSLSRQSASICKRQRVLKIH